MLFSLAVVLIFVNAAFSSELYCVNHHTQTFGSCKKIYIRPASALAQSNTTISFDLNCQADSNTCQGVRATLEKATEIISSVFQFESSLSVNATFGAFNSKPHHSKANSMSAIGQAFPTISYIMTDKSDNITRMYPQALLKQFTHLPVNPTWAQYDINAQFNSDVKWYFVNDPNQIQADQIDFLRNVVHEIIHGLGFMSSWSDGLYKGMSKLVDNLAPFAAPMSLSTLNDNPIKNYDRPFPFWGFIELPFDKFVYSGDTALSTLMLQLNTFGQSNVLFRNALDFANAWYTSELYPIATGLYQKMVTGRDLFLKANNQTVWLESSLNPFSSGSSLSHIDSSYTNSSEYLMVYMAHRGVSMHDHMIGSDLQNVMSALGYRIKGLSPVQLPSLVYWNPSDDLAGSSSNPSPSLVSKTGPAHFPATPTASSISCSFSVSSSLLTCFITNLLILLHIVL